MYDIMHGKRFICSDYKTISLDYQVYNDNTKTIKHIHNETIKPQSIMKEFK
jgi:hypothetical protein